MILSADRIEAAARELDPSAWRPMRIGCDSSWHYQSHSAHSSCPSGYRCMQPNVWMVSREKAEEAQEERRQRAREKARRVLEAAKAA